ncbi:MAG: hypothetical protein ACJ76P_08495 [Actinomycetota bacterium]
MSVHHDPPEVAGGGAEPTCCTGGAGGGESVPPFPRGGNATRTGAGAELAGGVTAEVELAVFGCPGNAAAATAENPAVAASDAARAIRVTRPEARNPISRMRPLRRFEDRLAVEALAGM